jgi:hypothetical protein
VFMVFTRSSSFPVIFVVFSAHPFFWHVQTISIYFPWFGSVYPPWQALLYVCVSDSIALGLSHSCSQEFHVSCLYFAFLSFSACPCLGSI